LKLKIRFGKTGSIGILSNVNRVDLGQESWSTDEIDAIGKNPRHNGILKNILTLGEV
jgi:hypothetical protein